MRTNDRDQGVSAAQSSSSSLPSALSKGFSPTWWDEALDTYCLTPSRSQANTQRSEPCWLQFWVLLAAAREGPQQLFRKPQEAPWEQPGADGGEFRELMLIRLPSRKPLAA